MRIVAYLAIIGLGLHFGYLAVVEQWRRFRVWLESVDFVAVILIAVACVAIYLEGK